MEEKIIEEKKNNTNKILIAIIIVLFIALCGITYYTFFMKDKFNQSNTIINYEVKEEGKYKYLYVNNKKVNNISFDSEHEYEIEQFNDLLLIEWISGYRFDIIDKNGDVVDYQKENFIDRDIYKYSYPVYSSYRVNDNDLYITYDLVYNQSNVYEFCDRDPKDPYEYEVKYEYLGNEKFKDGELVKTTSISEYDFNLTCTNNSKIYDSYETSQTVTYNDEKHIVKIKKESYMNNKSEGELDKYVIKISIKLDDKLIDSYENYNSDEKIYKDYKEKLYVFDNKYLGILASNKLTYGTSYALKMYNGYNKIGYQEIIMVGQSLAETIESEQLNTLDKLEFDGHKFVFWYMASCMSSKYSENIDKLLKAHPNSTEDGITLGKFALTIENDKINLEVVDAINSTGGGGAAC